MAIQNRRGQYADFDPTKAVAGEMLVVQQGDPNATDGKAVYMAFSSGSVKRLATYEDMVDNIEAATEDVAQDVAEQIEENLQPLVTTAQTAAQTATTKANEASQSASSVSASAAQIATNTSDISDLKSALNNISGQTKNLLPAAYQESSVRGTVAKYDYGVLTLTGAPTASGGRGIHLCPVFTLPAGTYYFSANGITSAVTGIYIQTNVGDTIVRNGSGAFTVASETDYYIGVNIEPSVTYNETIYLQIEQSGVATEFVNPATAKDIVARDTITEAENQLSNISDRFSIINRFDKSTALRNSYVGPGGGIGTVDAYSASDFIYIGDLESVSYCNTFRLSLYKSDKAWDSDPETQNTVGFVKTITRPSTAMYMRISYLTVNEDVVQVGANISVSQYYPYGKFRMPDLVTDDEPTPEDTVVYVSKSGRGSYTSLLEALASTDNDIEVVDGAFDIVAEYKAKYGNDFFTPGTDRSAAGDFALGLFITNRSVKFDANTSLSFDLSVNPASNTGGDDRRFCLFNLGVNVVLDGAIGTTNGNWYAIHDDGAGGDYAQNYKNVIKNCVLICQNMVNKNVIGGGFGRYSETYVENCYFDNGESGNTSYTIRYHNTWNGQAQPVCHIKNVYVNSLIYFGYYGGSTKIGTCTVNNCSMAGAIVLLPVTESSVENLRILEWANVIRN